MLSWIFTPLTMWGVAAAGVAVGAEYLYRTIENPWHHYLHWWVPIQLFIGFCVYKMVNYPNTSLIGAFIIFSSCTLMMRVGVSMALGDHIRTGTWIALALVVLARVAQNWR